MRSPKPHGWRGGRQSWAGTTRSRSARPGLPSPLSSATSTTAPRSSIGLSCSIRTWHGHGSSAAGSRSGSVSRRWRSSASARAMRLSPHDPQIFDMQAGIALGAFLCRPLRRGVVMGESGVARATELLHCNMRGGGQRRACRTARGSGKSRCEIAPASSPRCRSPVSRNDCRLSDDRRITPSLRRVCEEPG